MELNHEEYVQLKRDVSILQQDMAKISVISSRIDITIEKLTEVSTSVARLLAVHENRLEQQEKIGTQLASIIEKRKDENGEDIKHLYRRIAESEKETYEEIQKITSEIVIELKAIRKDQNTRITKIERCIWLISGGSVVLGFLLSQGLNVIKLFF